MSQECPVCGNPMLPGKCNGVLVLSCLSGCTVPTSTTAPVLEKDLCRQIVATLRRDGYIVLVVGQLIARGSGTTVGTPDLFVSRTTWGGLWQAMEVKTATGRVRPEQQALVDAGFSAIVRTAEQALELAAAVNARLTTTEGE
jgi:hypothetical protein